MVDIRRKRLAVFDLDGTLARSKAPIDDEMSSLLANLLQHRSVAVIGGGSYEQFTKQFVTPLSVPEECKTRIYLFPGCSTRHYRYVDGAWQEIYAELLSDQEKEKIRAAFSKVLQDVAYVAPEHVYGVTLEDRGSQMSWSPLGQDIVSALGDEGIHQKEVWKASNDDLRLRLRDLLQAELSDFEVRVGGLTTIDVTRKGIDKGYGIRKIESLMNIAIADMVFVGDALYPGGNDFPAKEAGVECIQIKDPEETKTIIRSWLEALATPA